MQNNTNLNKQDIEFLIDCLKNRKEIPEVYKYAIFPTKQKEYELVYAGKMRKEDVRADTEEAKPVPLQIEKVFNGKKYPLYSKDWHNLLVFGDNLQILKTFNENKDPLVKNKIKGKVKLIYIDPPFATEKEFQTGTGVKAYSDKAKGAEFIEFLRRRLIVARELLSADGCIYVHLDWKKSHYIKLLLDEIFGENNFLNEVVWYYRRWNIATNLFARNHDVLLFYANNKGRHAFNNLFIPKSDKSSAQGKAWKSIIGEDGIRRSIMTNEPTKGVPMPDVWEISMINPVGIERTQINYPTQKPEALLERLIKASTNEGDLVLDFFCGSGTTLAVAEKLKRRWIGCDIGKLAIYTTQKRLFEINQSKDLIDIKKKYDKPAKSFAVVTSGLYDLGKIFNLQKDEYIRFVRDLFEIEETKTTKISGVEIDGKKRGFYAKIFPYWELKNTSVDEKYLQELHKNIGGKIDGRFYIIAPANNTNFISDYHQIGDIRYYFLKVPYQIIKELHKVQFRKFRQPQSKSRINDLDEAVGFHFIRQPDVKSEFKATKDKVTLTITKFESAYSQDETGEKLQNFESLAMILIDFNYNGELFMMNEYFFAQDLLKKPGDEEDKDEAEIRKELQKHKEIVIDFERKMCSKQIMVIYIDIYGNEFREVFKFK